MKKLETQEVTAKLQALPQWTLDESGLAITRNFVLHEFMQAFAFMTQIAIAAEKHNHHPEWRNVYNRVHITWTTHDADGLTTNDMEMARFCDQASHQVSAGCAPSIAQ